MVVLFGNFGIVIHGSARSFQSLSCGESRGLRSEAVRRQVGVAGTKGRVTRVHERDLRFGAGELNE